jgi:branched-chain amino acid transport system ATP-binding protein
LPDATRAEPLLKVQGLSAGYGRSPVVCEVNLDVGVKEVVTVIGPNGAGKSTLLKALTGNLPLMAGTISLGTQDVSTKPAHQLARLGVAYVPQVNDTFNTLTVQENLELGGYLLPKRELGRRVAEVLTVFPHLASMTTRRAQKLSGGERKMLAMARVLLTRPKVVILDEPTAGLSPQMADRVLKGHVPKLTEQGAAVLLVEQRASEALEVSDWGYVLVNGQILLSADAARLREREDIADVFLGAAHSG